MASLQSIDSIKTEITIGFANCEHLVKKELPPWCAEQGWELKEYHKGLSTSRLTFSQEFDSSVEKKLRVQKVFDKLHQLAEQQK